MPSKDTVTSREVASPTTDPVTKFGGQPVWVEEPSCPVSRADGTPMSFVCQIALPADRFGGAGPHTAYVFTTDDYSRGGVAATCLDF